MYISDQMLADYNANVNKFAKAFSAFNKKGTVWVHWVIAHSGFLLTTHRTLYLFLFHTHRTESRDLLCLLGRGGEAYEKNAVVANT